MRGMKRAIPWLLLSVRVMIVPLLVVAAGRLTDRAVLWLYVAAFATDYFDGASARYFWAASPAGDRLEGQLRRVAPVAARDRSLRSQFRPAPLQASWLKAKG